MGSLKRSPCSPKLLTRPSKRSLLLTMKARASLSLKPRAILILVFSIMLVLSTTTSLAGWRRTRIPSMTLLLISSRRVPTNWLFFSLLIILDSPEKKTGGFKTVCSAYRDQLGSLMNVLHSTHPHFIRCIVPNNTKTPGKVEADLIMHQLTCNGVLEGIRICQIGLPNRVTYPDFMLRYKILGAEQFNTIPDKKKAVAAVFEKIGIDADKYRVGNTKVFFRAGVLGEVEEIRDDYLGRLIGFLQAQIRGWKSRKWFKKAQTQRVNLIVVQRNLRKYMQIRTWLWYGFWQQLKPKLQVGREQKMLEALEAAAVKAEENVIIANEKNVKFGAENEVLLAEKNALLDALEESKGGAAQYLAKEEKLMAEKADVEGQLSDAQKKLFCETEAKDNMYALVKKTEHDVEKMKEDLEDMGGKLLAAQQDKEAKDAQLKTLGEEIAHQEDIIAKLNKDKKDLFDANQKTAEDHQNIEDKCNTLWKQKGKMEQQLDELEDSLEREKKLYHDMWKAKGKVEGDYKLAYEAVADLERANKDLEDKYARKDSELAALGAKIDDEHLGTARVGKQAKELLARYDELEDEYKAEYAARTKAEKHKALLFFNYEELSVKLEEAGGATANQVELNKKREAEIYKWKHDLEELNAYHEGIITAARKKNDHAISEMSEQVDYINEMKARSEKDKESMRMEYDDAKAALDNLARDKSDA